MSETTTNQVGKDVWWDTSTQKFRKKRINLDKIPLKYRCPNCGKIMMELEDRKPIITSNFLSLEYSRGMDRWIGAFRSEYPNIPREDFKRCQGEFNIKHPELNDYVERYEEPALPPIELGFHGGVCEKCWLDGFGAYGEYGRFMKTQLKKEQKELNKSNDKTALWINGKLRLTKGIIEINQSSEFLTKVEETKQ